MVFELPSGSTHFYLIFGDGLIVSRGYSVYYEINSPSRSVRVAARDVRLVVSNVFTRINYFLMRNVVRVRYIGVHMKSIRL